VFRTELWKKSGHYENYKDDMFLLDVNDEEYGLKPMNCPGHATIFDQQSWSYRDLPQRYFENGKVYRKSSAASSRALARLVVHHRRRAPVRPARPDPSGDRVGHRDDLRGRRDAGSGRRGRAGDPPRQIRRRRRIWESAEEQLRDVLESGGYEYDVEPGDGAFYGPKIDFGFEGRAGSRLGRPHRPARLQHARPVRPDLHGRDNEDHQPVMIHRALYGSYERFFMVLIEHFDGDFPLWLAPEQVRILPSPTRRSATPTA